MVETLRASEERFRATFEQAAVGLAHLALDGRWLRVNRTLCAIVGYGPDDLRDLTVSDLLHPEDRQSDVAEGHQLVAGELPSYGKETRLIRKDGAPVWIGVTVSLARMVAGDPVHLIVAVEDITGRKATVEALRRSEEQYRRIVETAQEGIWQIDAADCTTFVNQAMADLLGYTADEMRGVSLFSFADDEGRAAIAANARQQRQGLKGQQDVKFLRKDGRALWTLVSAEALFDVDGRYAGTLAMVVDITERIRAEEALRHQALHNALTDLPNRTLLQDRLAQALRIAQRDGRPLALLLLDLDRFKEVNDTFGHAAGDHLLRQVGRRLRRVVRATDTVARLGGDEFAVLLSATDTGGATTAAEKIRRALEQPVGRGGYRVSAEASIGIALYPAHGAEAATLLQHADVAMYAAKRTGGGVRARTGIPRSKWR